MRHRDNDDSKPLLLSYVICIVNHRTGEVG